MWTETCTHQLCLTQDDMAEDTRLKWNPPTRDRDSVEELWQLLAEGHVHTIGSDHAPLPKTSGRGHLDAEPGRRECCRDDVPGLRDRGDARARHSDHPGRRPALDDAGEAVWPLPAERERSRSGATPTSRSIETDGRRTLDARELEFIPSQERWSPFDGRELRVFPQYTIVRGRPVFAEGEIVGDRGYGRYLVPARASAPDGAGNRRG